MSERVNIDRIDRLYRSAEVLLPDIEPRIKDESLSILVKAGYRPVAGAIGNWAINGAQALRLIGSHSEDENLVAGPYAFGFASPEADSLKIIDNGVMLYTRPTNTKES